MLLWRKNFKDKRACSYLCISVMRRKRTRDTVALTFYWFYQTEETSVFQEELVRFVHEEIDRTYEVVRAHP